MRDVGFQAPRQLATSTFPMTGPLPILEQSVILDATLEHNAKDSACESLRQSVASCPRLRQFLRHHVLPIPSG